MKEQSSSVRYLKGEKYPDDSGRRIKDVLKEGPIRTLVFTDGSKESLSKKKLNDFLQATIASNQKAAMEKTIRKTSKGYNVTIGGHEKGTRETYKTKAAAKAALTRAYGQ